MPLPFPSMPCWAHFSCPSSPQQEPGWWISKMSVSSESCHYYFELAGIGKRNQSCVSRNKTGDGCISTQGNGWHCNSVRDVVTPIGRDSRCTRKDTGRETRGLGCQPPQQQPVGQHPDLRHVPNQINKALDEVISKVRLDSENLPFCS